MQGTNVLLRKKFTEKTAQTKRLRLHFCKCNRDLLGTQTLNFVMFQVRVLLLLLLTVGSCASWFGLKILDLNGQTPSICTICTYGNIFSVVTLMSVFSPFLFSSPSFLIFFSYVYITSLKFGTDGLHRALALNVAVTTSHLFRYTILDNNSA